LFFDINIAVKGFKLKQLATVANFYFRFFIQLETGATTSLLLGGYHFGRQGYRILEVGKKFTVQGF